MKIFSITVKHRSHPNTPDFRPISFGCHKLMVHNNYDAAILIMGRAFQYLNAKGVELS